jgi:circadian clock protein KaiC
MNGERNRGLYVLKSRGMAHSNQIREFVLGERGVELVDVYVGASGVLTGSARLAQTAREEEERRSREWELERKRRDMTRKRRALEARMAALEAEFDAEFEEMERTVAQDQAVAVRLQQDRSDMARRRSADIGVARPGVSDLAIQGNGNPE